MKTGEQEFVSVTNNEKISVGPHTDSARKFMSDFTDAWFETSKYLLLNNKKKN
jgi:hypothetical protein